MGEVAQGGRTVLFVSHNMGAIKALCPTGLYLDLGKLQYHGNISSCVEYYLNSGEVSRQPQVELPENPTLPIQLSAISVIDEADNLVNQHPYDQPLWIKIIARVRTRVSKYYIALHVSDSDLNTILFSRDFESNKDFLLDREPGIYTYLVQLPGQVLVPGNYRISVHLAQSSPAQVIQRADYVCPFEVLDIGSVRAEMGFPWYGKVAVPLKWTIKIMSFMP
jgi:lipopolysaccharide transport system ATP-binding protein